MIIIWLIQNKTIDIKSSEDLPPLRNPDILIGADDLTNLSYLHEPAGIVCSANGFKIILIYQRYYFSNTVLAI